MRRGTNPVLTFELPEAITISALYITFQQNRQTVLEKDLTAVTYDKESGIITLPLSQEDTLRFRSLSLSGCNSACGTIWTTPLPVSPCGSMWGRYSRTG